MAANLSDVLRYLIPQIRLNVDCVLQDDGDGVSYIAVWRRPEPQPTPAEIAAAEPAAQAAWEAEQAARVAADAEKAKLREQFLTLAARLQQITDAASPTNAQVITAVRDLATIQRLILRALYGILTD